MKEYKIGAKELTALVLLTVGLKLSDTTPTLLFNQTFTATWMVPIFGAVFIVFPVMFLWKVIKKYDGDLVDIINSVFGTMIGSFICFVIFIISLLSSASDTNNYVGIMNTMFFPQTPKIFLYMVFIFACYLIAKKGALTIARTAWIVLPYIKLAMLLLIVLDVSHMTLDFMFPIFGEGIDTIIKVSFLHQSIFGEIMFLAMLLPYLKEKKSYKIGVFFGLSISTFELALFFLIYVWTFDGYPLRNMMFPFQILTRTANLGRFFTNFDAYFFAFWIVASLIRFSVYIYITTALFTGVFKIKENKGYYLPIATLIVILGLIPDNVVKNAFTYRESILLYITSLVLFCLPMIMWVISLKKKKVSS